MSKKNDPKSPELPPGNDHKGKPTPPEKPPEKPPEVTPPAPPAEKPLTAEELAAKAKEMTSFMFPKPGRKQEPEPPPPAAPPVPAAVEPPKPPEPAPAPKPEPKPEKKPLPPPIAEAVDPSQLQKPTPKPEPVKLVADGLTDDDHETLAALARMEKDGKATPGMVDRTKRFWKDEEAYIAQWQTEHPGETFDPNAEAHFEFYDKNEPSYDEVEFNRAKKTNLREGIKKEVSEELRKETADETYAREMRDHAPKTEAAVHEALRDMVADAGFEDLMKKDGKVVLDKSVEEEIDKASPHARSILMEEAQVLSAEIAEIDRLEKFPGKYQIDPNLSVKLANGTYVQPHRMLMDFAVGLEKEIAALAPEDTVRDGKRFTTQDDFQAQVNRIMSSEATNEAKAKAFDKLTSNYYTLGWEDIRTALVVKHSTQAKAKIERFGGRKKSDATPPAAKTDTTPPPAAPPVVSQPSKAPSVSSSSDVVDTARKPQEASGITKESVVRTFWGG